MKISKKSKTEHKLDEIDKLRQNRSNRTENWSDQKQVLSKLQKEYIVPLMDKMCDTLMKRGIKCSSFHSETESLFAMSHDSDKIKESERYTHPYYKIQSLFHSLSVHAYNLDDKYFSEDIGYAGGNDDYTLELFRDFVKDKEITIKKGIEKTFTLFIDAYLNKYKESLR